MKKNWKLLCGVLFLALALTACFNGGAKPANSAGSQSPANSAGSQTAADSSSQQQEEIEDWRAEQKIVVNGETHQFLLRGLCSVEGDDANVRLDSDVRLTDFAIILGTSDYGGMFNGQEMTVPPHNIVMDLNGHTLTAEADCAVFEVQAGYTLTVVDNSADKTGKLVADGEAVVVEDGGTYIPLSD